MIKPLRAALAALLFLTSFSLFAAPVDINSADATALADGLLNVGPSKAQAIVEYRENYGEFKSIEELANVKGIGPATIEKNRDNMIVNIPEEG